MCVQDTTLQESVKVLVSHLCPTLCDPMACSPPDPSVCGILQARILEWVSSPLPGDLFDPGIRPRDQTQVSRTAGRFFPSEPPGKPMLLSSWDMIWVNSKNL